MSQFNTDDKSNNPFTKKQDKAVNEQINKLVEFYDSIKDDTNMSYIIDTLEEVHDSQVFIKTQLTLLKEELHAFEKKFDEEINYGDTEITKIRDEATHAIKNAISNQIIENVEDIEKNIDIIESNAINKIRHTIISAQKRVSQNNKHIIDMKVEKKSVNIQGYLILFVSSALLILNMVFLLDTSTTSMKLKSLDKQLTKQQETIKSIQEKADDRFYRIGKVFEKLKI